MVSEAVGVHILSQTLFIKLGSGEYLIMQLVDNKGGSSSQSSIPIIAGAAGGTILFVIIIVCIMVVFCVTQSKKRKSYPITSVYSNEHVYSDTSKTGLHKYR